MNLSATAFSQPNRRPRWHGLFIQRQYRRSRTLLPATAPALQVEHNAAEAATVGICSGNRSTAIDGLIPRSERVGAWCGLHGNPAQVGKGRDTSLAAEMADTAALDAAERHLRLVMDGSSVDMANA